MEKFEKNSYKKLNSKSTKIRESQNSSILSVLNKKSSEKLDEEVAKKLINSWNIDYLVLNLPKFSWLSNEIAKILIKNWYLESLAKNLLSFQWLDKKTAKILIKDRYRCIKNSLISFKQLDNDIALIFVVNNDYAELAKFINRFEKLSNDILLLLLIKANNYKHILVRYRHVFPDWWEYNSDLLYRLKLKWQQNEYKKLKEFYDLIRFEKIKENFESDNNFDEWFNIDDAKRAIKYEKWKYVIKFLDKFRWNYRELINLLIEWKYIEDLKNNISKLWWKNIDRYKLALEFAMSNNYNVLIQNVDAFENEWITYPEIATIIIKNSDPECRDAINKINEFQMNDEEDDRNRINYNLDMYKLIKKNKKTDFIDLIEYFQSDFSPISYNRKLPIKLRNLVRSNFWLNTMVRYINLFEE